jgi:hypothetical protein
LLFNNARGFVDWPTIPRQFPQVKLIGVVPTFRLRAGASLRSDESIHRLVSRNQAAKMITFLRAKRILHGQFYRGRFGPATSV